MERPPLDPKTLEGSFDTSGFCEIQIATAGEVRGYVPGNGWVVLKILQTDRIVEINRAMAYQNPGNCPQTHCYTDKEVIHELSFVMGRREKSVVEDLARAVNDQRNENYSLADQIRESKSKLDKKDAQIIDLSGQIRSLQDRLQEEKAAKEKAQDSCKTVTAEHESLKDTLLKTLVKLPGGNEATLTEAIGMVKTHEILGAKP